MIEIEADDRKQIARKIQEVALMYGKHDLTREYVTLTINLLLKVYNASAEEICKAFDRYMKDPKNRFFPAPAHLREYFKSTSEKINSTNLAHQISALIDKEGRAWVNGFYYSHDQRYWRGKDKMYWTMKEAIISYVGPVGYAVIESRGGWINICNSYYDSNDGTFIAQLRESINFQIMLHDSHEYNHNQLDRPPSNGLTKLQWDQSDE